MFQKNEIVTVDLVAYKEWYTANVRSGVWLFGNISTLYVEHDDGGEFVSIHGVYQPYGGGVPRQFITSEVYQFYWWTQANNWTGDVWEHEPKQADFDAKKAVR